MKRHNNPTVKNCIFLIQLVHFVPHYRQLSGCPIVPLRRPGRYKSEQAKFLCNHPFKPLKRDQRGQFKSQLEIIPRPRAKKCKAPTLHLLLNLCLVKQIPEPLHQAAGLLALGRWKYIGARGFSAPWTGYQTDRQKEWFTYPFGLARHFVVEAAAAVADLIVDVPDGPAILEQRVSLC